MSDRSKKILQWVVTIPIAFYVINESFFWISVNEVSFQLLPLISILNLIAIVSYLFSNLKGRFAILLMGTRLPLILMSTNDIEALFNLTIMGFLAFVYWLSFDDYIPEVQSS